MKTSCSLFACITLMGFLFIGCLQSKPKIVVGDKVDLVSEIIDEGGGTIVIDKPGDPLDGFTLEVPGGSYGESKTFEISYRPVEGHNLTGGFSPITPLIKADNGGDRAQKAMTVTIPIDLPEGHFATAFFYDETTNRLEGMTFVDLDDSTLTVATSHFSEFIILSILEDDFPHNVDSGFKVGEDGDGWQFTNQGSYITPRGNCLGQSMMALYYYIEKKKGEGKPSLYGEYDNDGNIYHPTPKIWQDDVLAYRLCSTAQKTVSPELSLYKGVWIEKEETPLYNLYSFYAGIYLEGDPQYVEIERETAKSTPEKPDYSSHAMVVHKITRRVNEKGEQEAVLHIYDPNYPKEEQEIVYNFNGKAFEPYDFGGGIKYPGIYFRDRRSWIDPIDFSLLWGDFEGGVIGDDCFPDYTIYICKKNPDYTITDCEELVNGYTVTGYESYCFKVEVDGKEAKLEIYDEEQNKISSEGRTVEFKEGGNYLGFYVNADVTYENADGEEKTTEEWVGFEWLDVMYEEGESETFRSAEITLSNLALSGYYEEDAEYCKDGWSDPHATISVQSITNGILNGTTFTATWEADPENIYELTSGDVEINFKDDSLTEITSFDIKSYTYGDAIKEISFILEATGLTVKKDDSSSTGSALRFVQDGCSDITLLFDEYKEFYPNRQPCKTKVLETVECSSNSSINIDFYKE